MSFNPEDAWNSPFFDRVATEWRQARGEPMPKRRVVVPLRRSEPPAPTPLAADLGPTQFPAGSDEELLAVSENPLLGDEKEEIRDNALSVVDKLEAAAENAESQLKLTPAARWGLALALEEGQRLHSAALRLGR